MTTQPTLFDVPVQAPTVTAVARERQRLNAAAVRVLERLKAGPATNVELSQPSIGGLRFGGRLHDAHDGWTIQKEHVSGGTWRYRLSV